MPRERQVFDTDEIPHLWAHKTQAAARNSAGNLFFSGETIYSYGRHFPIARHAVIKGRPVILFTTSGYSVTTAKHIGMVRAALPPGCAVLHCSNPASNKPADILAQHKRRLASSIERLSKAKSNPARASAFRAYERDRREANHAAETLGYKVRFHALPDAAELEAIATAHESAVSDRANAREAARSARWREADRIRKLELSERIELWRSGSDVPLHNCPTTLLRIVGDEVQTSRGARFPLDHARRAMPLVSKLLETRQTFHANGQRIHLGHYQIDRIEADGTIVAGCHRIERDEVLRLIETLQAA